MWVIENAVPDILTTINSYKMGKIIDKSESLMAKNNLNLSMAYCYYYSLYTLGNLVTLVLIIVGVR